MYAHTCDGSSAAKVILRFRFFGELITLPGQLQSARAFVVKRGWNCGASFLHAGKSCSRTIYELVWGLDGDGNSDTIMEHIRKIQAGLRIRCNYIETVWGCGYRWTPKNMGLKSLFLFCLFPVYWLSCYWCSFLWCNVTALFPLVEYRFLQDGTIVKLEEPTASQQTILSVLGIIQVVSCIALPMGGLALSGVLYYHIKLKQPICRIAKWYYKDSEPRPWFIMPVRSGDELGNSVLPLILCAKNFEIKSGTMAADGRTQKIKCRVFPRFKKSDHSFERNCEITFTSGTADKRTIDRLESHNV